MSNEFDDLRGTGYKPPEETSPEEEFFHSIYIGGITRKNHIGVFEEAGKLHIRGVQYNLNEVYMIITHVKTVLIRKERSNNREKVVCFSYQNTNPWKGRSNKICPTNREERDSTTECTGCRSEIIISGILCEKNGIPILIDNKPIFVFIRGRGIRSPNVYEYLEKLSKMEVNPPIFPDDPTLEKLVAKNKRHVTIVGMTTTNSKHGIKNVFSFDVGSKLEDSFVKDILRIQKKTISQFNEKFDWSNIQTSNHDGEQSYSVVSETETEPTGGKESSVPSINDSTTDSNGGGPIGMSLQDINF